MFLPSLSYKSNVVFDKSGGFTVWVVQFGRSSGMSMKHVLSSALGVCFCVLRNRCEFITWPCVYTWSRMHTLAQMACECSNAFCQCMMKWFFVGITLYKSTCPPGAHLYQAVYWLQKSKWLQTKFFFLLLSCFLVFFHNKWEFELR